MNPLNLDVVFQYVEQHISTFHQKRIESLGALRLTDVLKRKNPYLFKAKNIFTAQDLIKGILDAYLSSNEETIFGDFLEGLAIFVCEQVYGGWKSSATGIDLEFDRESRRYIIAIKSGPNWGNSSQIARLVQNFVTAKKILRTGNSGLHIVAVNGCCYGKENNPDKGEYYKYCGQQFWEFISGNENLYLDIIEPLGHSAKERNEEFYESYGQVINRLTLDFGSNFCKPSGAIDWETIVKFTSASGARP